jgi:hypothetical protein
LIDFRFQATHSKHVNFIFGDLIFVFGVSFVENLAMVNCIIFATLIKAEMQIILYNAM